jgi:hypothetical protein
MICADRRRIGQAPERCKFQQERKAIETKSAHVLRVGAETLTAKQRINRKEFLSTRWWRLRSYEEKMWRTAMMIDKILMIDA